MTPFEILNIEPTNDKMLIRRAYVRETKIHHPDQGGNVEQLNRIQLAYNELISNDLGNHPIATEIMIGLHDFLFGCIATVVIKSGLFKGTMFEFKVPPMSYPGNIIKFHDNSLTHREIHVKLLELKSNDYQRLEEAIIIKRHINMLEAELGTNIEVSNFDGKLHKIKIPQETTADVLIHKISSEGFYDKKSFTRGDLTIIIEVDRKRYTNV